MKIEEYLGTLPAGMLSGADAELSQRSLREMFRLAGLGAGDTVYHLGCGRSAEGIRIALTEFGARRAVGVDSDASKLRDARALLEGMVQEEEEEAAQGAGLRGRYRLECADIRDADMSDATVILFWFANDSDLIDAMTERFGSLGDGTRILTVWGPLPGCLPDAVDFPYVMCKTPLRPARDVGEQLKAVFKRDCVDFVTAWEHAERYTKALGPPGTANDRFLTIIQTLTIWTNAWRLGIACGEEIPEPISTYVKLMKMNFDIDFDHMLRRDQQKNS